MSIVYRNLLLYSFLLILSTKNFAQSMNDQLDLESITNTVEVNGMNFPIYDYGEGTPVLLLHGFPDTRYLWRNQLPALGEAGYRIIAPDLRGYGGAPKPKDVEAYAIPLVLEDLTGLLDTLGIDKVHVVGHDWGGTVAWLFAGSFPDRTLSVTGMTVGAPGGTGRRALPQLEKLWYIFFFQNEGVAEEWLSRDDWQGLRAWTREKGDFDDYIERLGQPGELTAGLNWYRANFKPVSLNTTSNPPRIKVPAMGISAENDAYLLPQHVKGSEVMIDASWEYHLVEDSSHWLMLDKPEIVNELLIDFLNRQ